MKTFYKRTAPVLLAGVVLLCVQMAGLAAIKDMKTHLPDDYLVREFAWSMVVYVPDSKNYLNYKGSSLHPLTRVCVNFNEHSNTVLTKFYEEFWYRKKAPVGLRRHNQLQLQPDSDGTIIVCPNDDGEQSECSLAVADVIVRLMLDVHFHRAVASYVMVPDKEYDAIAQALQRYGFYPEGPADTQPNPLSLRLRAYPKYRDELFLLHN